MLRTLLAVVVALVVAACGSAQRTATATTAPPITTTPATSPAEAAWTEDMAAFAEAVRSIHPNPFWREPEADFDREVAAAPARLARMSPSDARVEVMRLAALIDGHTGVYPSEAGFHLYAMRLYLFTDGIHVSDDTDASLIGARVVRIGDTPIDEAIRLVTPYGAHDNDSTVRVVVPMLLMTPEVLEATGIVSDGARPAFVVQPRTGPERTVDPPVEDWGAFIGRTGTDPVGLPKTDRLFALARRDEPFWWTTLDHGRVLYLQYNQVVRTSGKTSLESVVEELRSRIVRGGIRRLIIDLRNNPGGDNRTYGPLLEFLRTDEHVNRPGALSVIIGRQTFSASTNFATEVDRDTAAIFVGEPTGGRPNLYGDTRSVQLPNSGLTVQVSSRYWDFGGPDDHRPWIAPDVSAELSSDDFVRGRDPVLAAALR